METGEEKTLAEMRDAGAPVAPVRARRSLWFRLGRGVTVLGVVVAVGGVVALWMSRSKPAWWREVDPADKSVLDAAQRVENGAATQLTKIRKMDGAAEKGASEPWTIKLTAADANAWLAARLRPWLESQENARITWPRDLDRVEVEFEGGKIHVGAAVRKGAGVVGTGEDAGERRFWSATVRPELRADGALWLPAASLSMGRLALPPSWMLGRGKSGSSNPPTAVSTGAPEPVDLAKLAQMKDITRALSGERPAMQTAVIKIGDGRRVRILGLEAREGALYITCQTLPREAARAGKE